MFFTSSGTIIKPLGMVINRNPGLGQGLWTTRFDGFSVLTGDHLCSFCNALSAAVWNLCQRKNFPLSFSMHSQLNVFLVGQRPWSTQHQFHLFIISKALQDLQQKSWQKWPHDTCCWKYCSRLCFPSCWIKNAVTSVRSWFLYIPISKALLYLVTFSLHPL